MARTAELDRLQITCPVEITLDLIDGKWKGIVLFHLGDGPLRFNELRRRAKKVTQRMLTRQLRELETDGLIERKVFAEVPPRVEYRLSPRGETLTPIIAALKTWGTGYMAELQASGEAARDTGEAA